jgi:hypothetical protein
MKFSDFRRLEESEEVIVSLYEHWIVLFKPIFAFLLGTFVFWFLLQFVDGLYEKGQDLFPLILNLVAYSSYLFLVHWVAIFIFQWSISDWYVTSKRLISFELLVLVKHDVTFVHLERIHEIEEIQHGLFANIFNYGDILLNLSALSTGKKLRYLPQPSKFIGLIEEVQKTPPEELDIAKLKKKYRY